MERGGLIPRRRRSIAVVRDLITGTGRLDARMRSLPALLRAAIAKVTCDVVLDRVAALHEVPIARFLIAVGRSLIAVGRRLIAVRPRLVGVCQGLIAIGERLIAIQAAPGRGDTLVRCLDLPVGGIPGKIVWREVGHVGPPVARRRVSVSPRLSD
jgi:hypothetical protein